MKLAISNIGWKTKDDAPVADLLSHLGVQGVEIAPTTIWERPLEASGASIQTVREWWESRGIQISSFQALLFGRPDLLLFGAEESREQMLEYLEGIMKLAAGLGARPLVFGSPKNRLAGDLDRDKAFDIATDFFRQAGRMAHNLGVTLCVEPNPPQYGCDFINTLAEGAALVRAVNSPGCRLQLDGSSLILNEEPVEEAIESAADCIGHVHISEPFLSVPGQHEAVHKRIAAVLRKLGYTEWVSVEMREAPPVLDAVRQGVSFAKRVYLEEADVANAQ